MDNDRDQGDVAGRIAIIGAGCRVGNAQDVDALWAALVAGHDSYRALGEGELLARGVSAREFDDPSYVRASRSLKDVESFDATFFDMAPREAQLLDPQQRVFLECCHEALESAGYPSDGRARNVSVFAGSTASTYMMHHVLPVAVASGRRVNEALMDAARGNDKDYLATNVSYRFNFNGPSLSINTACSTSLMAVVQACKSLLDHESDMALAGGVRIEVPSGVGYRAAEGGAHSADGRCRPFDAAAGGTVYCDAAGVVLLKRLEDALADGDDIHATVDGFAMNNDGSAKVSFNAPSVEGQASVIREALAHAGVEPSSVGYVEAHGTGTVTGDPIEMRALQLGYPAAHDRRPYCTVGSLKANFGHATTAAGVLGLIKASQVLRRGVRPPQINFETPNPELQLEGSAFRITTQAERWDAAPGTRRAAVSSFGFGGSNVHIVLGEAPARGATAARPGPQLLVVSARSEAALAAQRRNLSARLQSASAPALADVAHTLRHGRRAFEHRAFVVTADASTAAASLDTAIGRHILERKGAVPAAFVFSGQGSQYLGMARRLYEALPVFREEVDRCLDALRGSDVLASVRVVLGLDPGDAATATDTEALVRSTAIAQPALFVMDHALARVWMRCGVTPAALIGHSLGEYVAACLAGTMSLRDALRLVVARGRLMQAMAPGAMLAVDLPVDRLGELHGCEVAAINGPRQCVVAGSGVAVDRMEAALRERAVSCKRLATSHAFHSAAVEVAMPALRAELAQVALSAPALPWASNLTGAWITADQAMSPDYWVEHMRRTVRFSDGLGALLERLGPCVLLECGPGSQLTDLATGQASGRAVAVASMNRHVADAHAGLLAAAGRCWTAGMDVEWSALAVDGAAAGQRVPLPTYPFQRQRHWIDVDPEATATISVNGVHKRANVASWFYLPSWKLARRPAADPAAKACAALRVLVFCDDVTAIFAQGLRDRGQDVVEVRRSRAFGTLVGVDGYLVDASASADWRRLADALLARSWRPEQVVHAWALAMQPRDADAAALDAELAALMHLGQSLSGALASAAAGLRLLTSTSAQVHGLEAPDAVGAGLAAACRVLGNELGLAVQHIDVDAGEPRARFLDNVLAELAQPIDAASIAFRNGRRWQATFEQSRLEPVAGDTSGSGMAHFVTGAFGALGRALSTHLAARPGAKLSLVSRRALPPRAEWDAALAADAAPASAIRHVLALEALGASILCLVADMAVEADVRRAVDDAHRHFGALDGVFHLAGEASSGSLLAKSVGDLHRVCGPKAHGAENLAQALQGRQPRVVVLFSSIAATTGGAGQFDYAAANAFQDALACRIAHETGARWISIGWDAWRDVGMAVDAVVPARLQRRKETELQHGIATAEGLDALERLLAQPVAPQVIVSTRDLEARLAHATAAVPRAPAVAVDAVTAQVDEASAPRGPTETGIAEVWRQLTGQSAIGRHDNFFALGGDSLLATRAVGSLQAQLGIAIDMRDFMACEDLEQLARLIDALGGRNAPAGEILEEQTW